MNERGRRLWATVEARTAGRGGFNAVIRATGMSPRTRTRGVKELDSGERWDPGRMRRSGGGFKSAKALDPGWVTALEKRVEPVTRGDSESPPRWTSKRTRILSAELAQQGHPVSHLRVWQLLHEAGYSLRGNRKTREGKNHPDRDARFEHLNDRVTAQLHKGEPAISADTKKKEWVGDFKNAGREWRPKGRPEEVRVHDFMDKEKGKAIPCGVYDMGRNAGWVSVGIAPDTASFAVNTIRLGWRRMGRRSYPGARSLWITADSGGSHGSRLRLWKWELQRFADETGLTVHVCHLPPGPSKWNKIEHRLFSFISRNGRGRPLLTHATIVNLIGATTTRTGLTVRGELDRHACEKGVTITDAQMQSVQLVPDEFHGDWNYPLRPRAQ